MIRIDQLWLCTAPMDMRAGAERLMSCVVQTVGAAHAWCEAKLPIPRTGRSSVNQSLRASPGLRIVNLLTPSQDKKLPIVGTES